MTKVCLEKAGERYSMTCKGHATGDERVCAAVSTLVGSLVNYLRCTEHPFDERIESGDACVRWTGAENAVFEFLCAGFLALQAADKERVRVEIKIF